MTSAEDVSLPRVGQRRYQFGLRTLVAMMLVAGVLLGRYGVGRVEQARERAVLAELEKFGADVQFHDGRVVQVSFSGARFRNEALDAARLLPQLERIVLIDTAVTDEGLRRLAGLKHLRELSVIDAPVTDEGLRHLRELTNLRRLRLDHTQVTDAGLPHLATLSQLERLDLVGTQITDDGLAPLAGLANLSQLYVNRTAVTEAGVMRLQASLPHTKISR